MRRLVGATLLLAAFVLVPGIDVHAQKTKPGKVKELPNVDSSKLGAGEFTGTLKSVPGSDRLFNLEIEQRKLVPTGLKTVKAPNPTGKSSPGYRALQAQNKLAQLQKQYVSAKNPQQARNIANQIVTQNYQLQLAMNQMLVNASKGGVVPTGYRIDTTRQTIEFQATEGVRVRTLVLPEQFDDKGNPKKLTGAELKTLRGKDAHLGGYESALEKLEVGQKVRVILSTVRKPSTKSRPKDGDKDADKDKDIDKDKDDAEKKMQVRTMIILTEAAPVVAPPKKGKKKN